MASCHRLLLPGHSACLKILTLTFHNRVSSNSTFSSRRYTTENEQEATECFAGCLASQPDLRGRLRGILLRSDQWPWFRIVAFHTAFRRPHWAGGLWTSHSTSRCGETLYATTTTRHNLVEPTQCQTELGSVVHYPVKQWLCSLYFRQIDLSESKVPQHNLYDTPESTSVPETHVGRFHKVTRNAKHSSCQSDAVTGGCSASLDHTLVEVPQPPCPICVLTAR